MTQPEYIDALLEILEQKGFDRFIAHYKPPQDATARFINQLAHEYSSIN